MSWLFTLGLHYPSSGVHWRPGIVVTADHTIGQEEDIQVTVPGGKQGRRHTSRPRFRNGHCRLEGGGRWVQSPPMPAEATAKVGELALVLGRSPDSGPNASLGVISAISGPWRTWRGGRLDQYIRLDATLFPNSSGGAVVDCRGQLAGNRHFGPLAHCRPGHSGVFR